MLYITNKEHLEAFVKRAKSSSVLAVDTEFLRAKTYYAKICLLQLATDDEVVLVDPFSVSDFQPLASLMLDESIVKLFHAGEQDIEILYNELGVLPHPVFDTQIAATLLGRSVQIGYGALVQSICGVTLPKIESYSDWTYRPLSDSQLDYAVNDVAYLPMLYRLMRDDLEEQGRLQWLDSDFEELVNPQRYSIDPRERFRHLKRVNQLTNRQLAAARELAAWREEQAQQRDVPRKWILSDEQIVEICKRDSRTIDDLFMIRGVKERLRTYNARKVIELLKKADELPEDQWPELISSSRNERNVDAEVDLMFSLVRLRAKEQSVAVQALTSHSELAAVARGYLDDAKVLKGWRREIVGAELLDLLNGRISLSLEGGNLKVRYNDEKSGSAKCIGGSTEGSKN